MLHLDFQSQTWRQRLLTASGVSAHYSASPHADGELAMQLECCQTEVEFVRRRLKQTEEKLENERQSRQQLDGKVRQDAGACSGTPPKD